MKRRSSGKRVVVLERTLIWKQDYSRLCKNGAFCSVKTSLSVPFIPEEEWREECFPRCTKKPLWSRIPLITSWRLYSTCTSALPLADCCVCVFVRECVRALAPGGNRGRWSPLARPMTDRDREGTETGSWCHRAAATESEFKNKFWARSEKPRPRVNKHHGPDRIVGCNRVYASLPEGQLLPRSETAFILKDESQTSWTYSDPSLYRAVHVSRLR